MKILKLFLVLSFAAGLVVEPVMAAAQQPELVTPMPRRVVWFTFLEEAHAPPISTDLPVAAVSTLRPLAAVKGDGVVFMVKKTRPKHCYQHNS